MPCAQEMRNVLYASLEFVLPRRAAKAQVGGLGKVIGIVMNFLPENVGLCIPTYRCDGSMAMQSRLGTGLVCLVAQVGRG